MILNLISGPRNISTALMYSFAQRKDMSVMDEPFYGIYLDKHDVNHPGREEILSTFPLTLDKTLDWIETKSKASEHLFIKNMGHHLIDMNVSFLADWTNVFLVRDPKQLIASFAEVIPNPKMQDIALQRQAEIFDIITDMTGQSPIVIDSNEVLKDPPKILQKVCDQVGITFDETMLTWEPNEPVVDVPWAKYWYANVQRSSGFQKQKTSSRPLPDRCRPLYESALPFYQKLSKNAIRA